MDHYDHLPLLEYKGNLEKRKKKGGRGGYKFPEGRDKVSFYQENINRTNELTKSYEKLKSKFKDRIDPHLIYRIEINQSVDVNTFDTQALHAMGIEVLSVAVDKKGYWVVFASDEKLEIFKKKLAQYSGIKQGNKYEFFNAIDTIEDIPPEEKIGPLLKEEPLTSHKADYLNIELWRMEDEKLIVFIKQLENAYPDRREFTITDKLITKSFALLRAKTTKVVLDEILTLKEIAQIDRPFIPLFKPHEYKIIDIAEFQINQPNEKAVGILVVDSGIVSNHPLLEKTVGYEENFQHGENETHDIVGHGTAVSGCAIYGDIENCINNRSFTATNWLFSAKVMYAEKDSDGKVIKASFDPEKLLEHQLDSAIRSFLDLEKYNIKVVNISFGNGNEIWEKSGNRQFPLASLIDDIAFDYPNVIFIISAGNQDPRNIFTSLSDIIHNYPDYLTDNPDYRIINPATSALALAVGSIASDTKIADDGHTNEDIWQPIAVKDQPSPFTRTGFGINGMIKPELVEYGGNSIYGEKFGRIAENAGGKIPLLSNKPTDELFTFDYV